MRKFILSLIVFLSLGLTAVSAQSDFYEYRQQKSAAFERHRTQSRERFDRCRDSLNRRYADFLEQRWQQFTLQKPEPLFKNPIVTPPVYTPTAPKPQPALEEIPMPEPVVRKPEPPEPAPVVRKPEPAPEPTPAPAPQPAPPQGIDARFFGTDIRLSPPSFTSARLSGTSEREIAAYWRALSKMPGRQIADDARRIVADLALNDWGAYQLLRTMFEVYSPYGSTNEQVVFAVFALNQMGYRAKIGRNGSELVPLLAFSNEATNCTYFLSGNTKYYVVTQDRSLPRSVEACTVDYEEGLRGLSLQMERSPQLAYSPVEKSRTYLGETFPLMVNRNLVDFYRDYPCTEFSVYTDAALDPLAEGSLDGTLRNRIAGLSKVEAVRWLLGFVQHSFEYKTDAAQFGYEKFFFTEEMIASSFADCEDRSILFSQLVRRLVGLDVVLIYYPGHLATAVRFDDDSLAGDYFVIDGDRYLICDPTYRGADIGMSMPDLRATPVEIIK